MESLLPSQQRRKLLNVIYLKAFILFCRKGWHCCFCVCLSVSLCVGYRHVYLEGMEEASVFVHVAVNDITGKVSSEKDPCCSTAQTPSKIWHLTQHLTQVMWNDYENNTIVKSVSFPLRIQKKSDFKM